MEVSIKFNPATDIVVGCSPIERIESLRQSFEVFDREEWSTDCDGEGLKVLANLIHLVEFALIYACNSCADVRLKHYQPLAGELP